MPARELPHRQAWLSPSIAPDLVEDFHPGPSPDRGRDLHADNLYVKTLTAGGSKIHDHTPHPETVPSTPRGGANIVTISGLPGAREGDHTYGSGLPVSCAKIPPPNGAW
jgi:hypothetical protein